MIESNSEIGILFFENLLSFNDVIHFTTTRKGGVSSGSFESFNLGNFSEDSRDNILKNREKLCEYFRIPLSSLYIPNQVHGTDIAIINSQLMQLPIQEQNKYLKNKDALITNEKNVCVAVTTADCVPILLYDADKQVIAAVHAGWKGTCNNIIGKTVGYMTNLYNCDPMNMHVAIGPSISRDAFEIGKEVYNLFNLKGFDMDIISFFNSSTNKYHIDLWKANEMQLITNGIPNQQIQIAKMCTYSQSKTFFSARRLGINSGRMLSGIYIS